MAVKPKTTTLKTDLVHLLSELVRLPTVSTDTAAGREALDWITWQLAGLPLHIKHFESDGFASLFISGRTSKKPKLLLLAHLDVVPGGPQLFEPVIKDGKLYGRGAFDMKFAVACYLKLLHELGDRLGEYDLGFMINTDEEVSGLNGANAMLEAGYGAEIVLNPDGAANWTIERGAKGYHEFTIESYGRSAHGGRPWEGTNAIDQLTDYLSDLRAQFTSEPCGDKNHHHNVLNVGIIEGGAASNQVPGYAKAIVSTRTLPGVSTEDIKDILGQVKSRHRNIQIMHNYGNPALSTDINNPHIQRFAKIITEHTGLKPQFILSHAASDARYFDLHHIPVLVSKPVGGPQHADDEWVDLKSLEQYYQVIREFVEVTAHIK